MVKPYRLVCGCHFVTTSFYIMEVNRFLVFSDTSDARSSFIIFVSAVITAMFTLADSGWVSRIFFIIAVIVLFAVLYLLVSYLRTREAGPLREELRFGNITT